MEERIVDVAVIGAGTAGISARREAVKAGARVLLIESGPYGTTCARVGCMPSKLLIAAANAAHGARSAALFGVHAAAVRVDGRAVMQRVREERDRFVAGVLRSLDDIPDDEKFTGRARFVAPDTLMVDNALRVRARSIVIAAGSSPGVPPFLRAIGGGRVIVNDDLFDFEDLPDSIAVIGAGAVGIELGQALHRLGVRTVIFDSGRAIGPLRDEHVQQQVRDVLGAELDIHLGVKVEAEAEGSDRVKLRWRNEDGDGGEDVFSYVLAATGRRPNLKDLDIKRAGLILGEGGVPVFNSKTLQCGESAVFIAGDVNGERPILHEAAHEGRIAGANAARFPSILPQRRLSSLSIVFTDPGMATVGHGPGSGGGEDLAAGEADFANQGRARVVGENRGTLRVYVERGGGRLVGAEIFAPAAEHLAHLLVWAIERGLTAREALELPFYHPTVEEGLRTAIRSACADLRILPREQNADLELGPGA
jgi:dihydrolipoamide dehydrogenase